MNQPDPSSLTLPVVSSLNLFFTPMNTMSLFQIDKDRGNRTQPFLSPCPHGLPGRLATWFQGFKNAAKVQNDWSLEQLSSLEGEASLQEVLALWQQ